MNITKYNIIDQAKKGNEEVLNHPLSMVIPKGSNWAPIHYLAYRGCKKVLDHPQAGYLHDLSSDKFTSIHILAWNGVIETMYHPRASIALDAKGRVALHYLAIQGLAEILDHPDVSKVKDNLIEGYAPIHLLAEEGVIEVLDHPDVAKIRDNFGNVPIHLLAKKTPKQIKKINHPNFLRILEHPSVGFVKNNEGITPLHYLAQSGWVTKEKILEMYPWYSGRNKGILKILNEIANTSNSEKYLFSLFSEILV